MSEQADADKGCVAPERQHEVLANDASNITIDSNDGERAAKRLKTDFSFPPESAPGEGLHDAPASKDTKENIGPSNGENVTQAEESKARNVDHVDGRVKGVAPIKKE